MKKPALKDKDYFYMFEAAEFYGLSKPKLSRMLAETEDLPFVIMFRTRKLIIRSEFEAYLKFHPEIKETLKNGKTRIPKEKRLKTPCTQDW